LNERCARRPAEPGTSPIFIPARPEPTSTPDLKRAAEDAEAFAKQYEGKIAAMDGKALGAAVARYEVLQDLMGRIGSYASLYYAQEHGRSRARAAFRRTYRSA